MTTTTNHDLSRQFTLELIIKGTNSIVLETVNGPQYLNTSSLFLVIDIFNNKPNIPLNKMVRTNIFINLHHLTQTLSNVHTTLLDDITIKLIILSLE